jgi:hypothetical protein
MLVLGLILVGIAVLLAAGVAASSGETATLEVFGVGVGTRSSVVFFTGVVITLALLLGLWMMKKGLARGYRRRKEVRELRQQVQSTNAETHADTHADTKAETHTETREETHPEATPAPVAAAAETGAEGNDQAAGKHRAASGDDVTPVDRAPGDEARSEPGSAAARAPVPPADRRGQE